MNQLIDLKTLDAFQTLYESATGYGLRKALNTKKDELEGQKREIDLEDQIQESHNEIEKLKGMSSKQPSGRFAPDFVALGK